MNIQIAETLKNISLKKTSFGEFRLKTDLYETDKDIYIGSLDIIFDKTEIDEILKQVNDIDENMDGRG